jgi:peptidoglycan hydrolase CwlO-like protein
MTSSEGHRASGGTPPVRPVTPYHVTVGSRLRVVAALLLTVGLLTLVPADAAPTAADARSQREEVRRQKVAVAGQLDALGATVEQLQEALDVLDANLRIEEAARENAEAEVARATKEAEEIRQRQADTAADLAAAESLMTEAAVSAYAKPPIEDDLISLDSGDLNQAVRKQALLDIVNNQNLDLTQQIRGLEAELKSLEDERLAALARAEAARAEVQARFDQVAQAQAQQQEAVDALDDRIDRLLSERQQLESSDKALTAEIDRQVREAAERAKRARRSGSSSGGGAARVPSRADLTSVRGITVHNSIADNLEGLLAAAEAAGVPLGGSGYRDSSSQIALRRAHCGSSDYAIYQMPAYQCSPPTARPGSSMHEQGLAIDFTSGGRVLTSGSAAFRWLQANAGRFGFRNLPSEPWHWSPNGN